MLVICYCAKYIMPKIRHSTFSREIHTYEIFIAIVYFASKLARNLCRINVDSMETTCVAYVTPANKMEEAVRHTMALWAREIL